MTVDQQKDDTIDNIDTPIQDLKENAEIETVKPEQPLSRIVKESLEIYKNQDL